MNTDFHFFQRRFPSANMVLVRGRQPLLVDCGYGSDLPETERLLRAAGTPPEALHLIVNTHYHADHVGGNHGLQTKYRLPIATHRTEGRLVNQRDPEVCNAAWLNQPVEPYTVDHLLEAGDVLDSGSQQLEVLCAPGHTLGHIALYARRPQVMIWGDVVHADDVSWINIFREGAGAMQRLMDTLETLARLPVRRAFSGHGPAIEDPQAAIAAALTRYERWLSDPQKAGWHACKRIFSYALMIYEDMTEEGVRDYLLRRSPWFHDYSRHIFHCAPEDFVQPLVDELLRSGAAEWREGRLVALTAHNVPPRDWASAPTRPANWPRYFPKK